jgi:hypothetical protein
MAEINLDPQVGEEVSVQGHSGSFRITKVDHCIDNYRTTRFYGSVDVEELVTGFKLEHIPVAALIYGEDRPVRRALEWLKTNRDKKQYPDYIVDYEVETGNDHAGNPSIFVRFLVDPDYFYENGRVSQEKIAALNEFTYEVQQTLLSLGLDRWTYVRAGEARRALDVAS